MNQSTLVRQPPVKTRAALLAAAAWLALIALCIAWELILAPAREGGSWLVLKAVPLLALARGVIGARAKPLQWALLLVHLYLIEAIVRSTEAGLSGYLALLELLLCLLFYVAAVLHLRPLKQAAKATKLAQQAAQSQMESETASSAAVKDASPSVVTRRS